MTMKKIAVAAVVLLTVALLFVGTVGAVQIPTLGADAPGQAGEAGAAAGGAEQEVPGGGDVPPTPDMPEPGPGYSYFDIEYKVSPPNAGTINFTHNGGESWDDEYMSTPVTLTLTSSPDEIKVYNTGPDGFAIKAFSTPGYKFKEWGFTFPYQSPDESILTTSVSVGSLPRAPYEATLTAYFEEDDTQPGVDEGENEPQSPAPGDANGPQERVVTYTGEFAYTFTIPDGFDFGSGDTFSNVVKINITVADPTQKVTMSVTETPSGERTLTHVNGGATIPYVISLDADASDPIKEKIFEVDASERHETSETLYFTLKGTPTKAGLYKDTLTFKTAVTDISSTNNE